MLIFFICVKRQYLLYYTILLNIYLCIILYIFIKSFEYIHKYIFFVVINVRLYVHLSLNAKHYIKYPKLLYTTLWMSSCDYKAHLWDHYTTELHPMNSLQSK